MSDTAATILSAADELSILSRLKQVVAQYRSQPAGKRDITGIFKCYAEALSVLKQNRQKLFDEIMLPLKDEIAARIPQDALSLLPHMARLAGQDSPFAQKIDEIIRKTPKQPKAKTGKTGAVADTPLVSMLKAEMICAIQSSKKLSDSEKAQQIEMVNNAAKIKVKKTDVKSDSLNIEGNFYELSVEGLKTIRTVIAIHSLQGPISRFGQITGAEAEELTQLSENKSKSYDTAIAKQAKNEKTQRRRQEQSVDKVRQTLCKLSESAHQTAVSFIRQFDSEKLYYALAVNNEQGQRLLNILLPDQDNGALQDNLRQSLLKTALYDDKVWGLYKGEEGMSYYNSLIGKSCSFKRTTEIIDRFMNGENTAENRQKAIGEIGGTTIPQEVALDVFLQGVFEYGMEITRGSSFSEEKFDKMNDVLQEYGYKIELEAIRAERTSLDSRTVSAAVRDDMPKVKKQKNQTIALMYRLGEALTVSYENDIMQPYGALYRAFCNIYYPDNSRADHSSAWKRFVKDSENQKGAKRIFQDFRSEAQFQAADGYQQLIERWLQRLSNGQSREEGSSDGHHIYECKAASVFNNYIQLFGHEGNIAITDTFHAADHDPHREAHRFDTQATYYYIQNGQYKKGAVSGIRAGDIVLLPRVLKKDQEKWKPIIEYDTLMVTSRGTQIAAPNETPLSKDRGIKEVINQNAVTISSFKGLATGGIAYLTSKLSPNASGRQASMPNQSTAARRFT